MLDMSQGGGVKAEGRLPTATIYPCDDIHLGNQPGKEKIFNFSESMSEKINDRRANLNCRTYVRVFEAAGHDSAGQKSRLRFPLDGTVVSLYFTGGCVRCTPSFLFLQCDQRFL